MVMNYFNNSSEKQGKIEINLNSHESHIWHSVKHIESYYHAKLNLTWNDEETVERMS